MAVSVTDNRRVTDVNSLVNFLLCCFAVEGITDVYTIENVKENMFGGHMSETPNLYDNSQGILFAYITKFNIDEEMDNFLITRWFVNCNYIISTSILVILLGLKY